MSVSDSHRDPRTVTGGAGLPDVNKLIFPWNIVASASAIEDECLDRLVIFRPSHATPACITTRPASDYADWNMSCGSCAPVEEMDCLKVLDFRVLQRPACGKSVRRSRVLVRPRTARPLFGRPSAGGVPSPQRQVGARGQKTAPSARRASGLQEDGIAKHVSLRAAS